MFTQVLDVSVPIYPGMVVYPGDADVTIQMILAMDKGDAANLEAISMGLHTGTHCDAPRHFVRAAATIDEVPLDRFVGWAHVIDATRVRSIEPDLLDTMPSVEGEILLFKTSNSDLWKEETFSQEFAYVSPGAANWLVQHRVKTVGVDYLSVERFGAPPEAHRILLGAGVCLVEGLNLAAAEPGRWFLVAAPLKIRAVGGAPARAILLR